MFSHLILSGLFVFYVKTFYSFYSLPFSIFLFSFLVSCVDFHYSLSFSCLSFYPILSLFICPPPAVAEDDKLPYTILSAQAALDKSCTVEGVWMGWGLGGDLREMDLI